MIVLYLVHAYVVSYFNNLILLTMTTNQYYYFVNLFNATACARTRACVCVNVYACLYMYLC